MSQRRVLVVDDEGLICWSLSKMLEKEGYAVETAENGQEARRKFQDMAPELILLDVCLPDCSGLDLLQEFRAEDEDVVIVMITANAHVDSAVGAFKLGAEDYIGKPFNMETVRHTANRAFEKRKLKMEVDSFRRGLRKKFEYDQLVGNCPKMIEVFKLIKVCAETDAKTVLVLGESGTGKELVARAIHQYSDRAEEPFIEVNCAAIPENLLENELFGHDKGAYTDASKRQKGIFELAEGGTVFLDEIGDMPMQMQAKILKVIETKRYRRLGGKEDLEADVRIVAATNQNLPRIVSEGKFRGDLFFRLNVMSILLPALRERKEDIPNLVQYFIERLNEEYGRSIDGIAEETMTLLQRYEWPGNVRELRNTIERAMMLQQGQVLTPAHLSCEVTGKASAHPSAAVSGEPRAEAGESPWKVELPPNGISIEEVEKELIQQAMERFGGNQTKAAQCLRMSRDTLRYRLKKFDLADGNGKEGGTGCEEDSPSAPCPGGYVN